MFNHQVFVFDTPLYEKISLDSKEVKLLSYFFWGKAVRVDGHCVGCARESVFHALGKHSGPTPPEFIQIKGINKIDLICQRGCGREINLFVLISQKRSEDKTEMITSVEKIGQVPSHADISIAGVKKFSDVLEQQDRTELVRAVGIASHGVNIGAFVYLRRVFERLISRAAGRMGAALDSDLFSKSRVDEKITLIADFLPSFMVSNSRVYSVLSKGIHELDEETCGKLYELMSQSIQLMLEQEQEIKKRIDTQASLSKLIDGISV